MDVGDEEGKRSSQTLKCYAIYYFAETEKRKGGKKKYAKTKIVEWKELRQSLSAEHFGNIEMQREKRSTV